MATLRSVLQAGKAEREKSKLADTDASARLDRSTLSRLLNFARPEARTLTVAVATLGFTTGISLVFPYAIGKVLDVAIAPAEALSPGTISVALLGLFVLQSGMIALRSGLLAIAGERMAARMRADLFKSILAQDIGWFDKHRTGDILTRLSNDVVVIQKAVTSNIAAGLRAGSMVAGGTAMLFYLSPSLALLSLSLIPPVALAGMAYGRYVQGQQKKVQEAVGRTMEVAEELISSVRTVRQFAAEGGEAVRFAERVDDSYRLARQIGIVAAYFDGAVHMAANVSLVAVLWYGGSQVMGGALSAGDLTAFLMYSLYTGLNISTLSTVYTDLKRASGAAARVFEVADRQPTMPLASDPAYWAAADAAISRPTGWAELRTPPVPSRDAATLAVGHAGLRRLESVRGDLALDRVTFAYPSRPDQAVLRDFSLALPAGKTLALVGGSGSGKSTVAALLTRLYDPSAGSVLVDGVDARSLDPQFLRGVIGVVSQEPILFAASIADNIRYGRPDATQEEVEAAARLANAHAFLTSFPRGYETLVGERGVQLSGGQKQRIAIARAILKNPPILVLDEATSALDAESEHAVQEALVNVMRGRTTLTIAHRLSTMRSADLVAVLAGGRVAEVGPFDKLFEDPGSAFRQLIDKQVLGRGGA
jgi:ABC-type multidrug transport system fused ATPase/permease subunit